MGRRAIALLSLFITTISFATETGDAEIPHPEIATDTRWMVVMLLISGAIILAALIVGPVVRANTQEETPPKR